MYTSTCGTLVSIIAVIAGRIGTEEIGGDVIVTPEIRLVWATMILGGRHGGGGISLFGIFIFAAVGHDDMPATLVGNKPAIIYLN